MNKIGILTCLYSNNVCGRVGCLKAFNSREDFFRDYGPDTELAAMMTCNGCTSWREQEPEDDTELLEQFDRLVSEGIMTLHVGACRNHHGVECRRMTKVIKEAEKKGIHVIRGTHKEHTPKPAEN